MQINWYIRFKNPQFIFQMILAVFTPVLAYAGLTFQDITSWESLGNIVLSALSNPYVLGLVAINVYNATTDPTVKSWLRDSDFTMEKVEPTKPDMKVILEGEPEVTDESKLIVKSEDEEVFPTGDRMN